MQKRYVKDTVRALVLLGCNDVESLRVATDWHVTALRGDGQRIYLRTLDDTTALVLTLSSELNGR